MGSAGGNYAYFDAVTISATDYYPFGMAMPSRTYNTEGYRYGFNGKENDSEWAKQDYGMRISDPRIARFLSIDPLTIKYPFYTPYQFASNTPIMAIDVDGMESDKQVNSTEKFVTGYKRGFMGQLNAIEHNIKNFFKDVVGSRFCPFGDCGNANSNKETYITPFVAPPTSAEGWEKLGASVGDKLYSLYDGDPEAWGEVAGASTWGYMSGSAIASSTAELRAANNVLDDLVVPATKTGPVLTEIEAVTLEQRAKDIHGSQTSPVARNKSTIAVAEVTNADGTKTTLVGSSRKYLTREERASLKVGEERVSGKGHAETTILDHAAKNGQKVERIGTSRPVCGKCAPALKEKGVKIESPEKAYKKPKI